VKKDIKLTYLKKATKFLVKHSSVITEEQVDVLVIKFIKRKIYNLDENINYKQMSGAISMEDVKFLCNSLGYPSESEYGENIKMKSFKI